MIATNAKSVVEQMLRDTGATKKELAKKMDYCDALGYTVSVAPRSGASRYELHTEK